MALEKVSTILKDADVHGYGVAAFNIFNYETITWAVQSAEEEGVPILIQFYPGFQKYIPLSSVAGITKDLASRVKVPIGLHLDHSNTFELALSGIKSGFPSIMIDGSTLSFEQNAEITRQVVQAAHAMGVEVEAELGHVGSGSILDDLTNSDHFTSPEQAAQFIEITCADSLAISIGNGHGQYIKTPSLDFQRLEEINSAVQVPLVLHGGSDIPDEQMQKAISLGINKLNIATEYNRAFYNALKTNIESLNYNKGYVYERLNAIEPEIRNFLRNKIRMLNPKGYHI
jgi:ketose-bisphosphate aldolase